MPKRRYVAVELRVYHLPPARFAAKALVADLYVESWLLCNLQVLPLRKLIVF
jgi:hypothetical protein